MNDDRNLNNCLLFGDNLLYFEKYIEGCDVVRCYVVYLFYDSWKCV